MDNYEKPMMETLDTHEYLLKLQVPYIIETIFGCSDAMLKQIYEIFHQTIYIILKHILVNINNSSDISIQFLI